MSELPNFDQPEKIRHSNSYEARSWYNESVLHIYPRSFNEERPEGEAHRGIGSILGITERLDDVKNFGATAIWLGPIYKSPGLDAGYDVADYRQIDKDLGTVEDVNELIKQAHERDIRVIFDLVPNHTSDQSEWFKASEDAEHPDHDQYQNYYIWHPGQPGDQLPEHIIGADRLDGLPDGWTVPNNWSSIFSLLNIDSVADGEDVPATTAWVWSKKRQMFYLAEFRKEQPSLNHSNPAVREEMKGVMRYWFDQGVDGFRIDVANHIGKDYTFQDEELAETGNQIGQYNNGVTNPHDRWQQTRLVSHWPELGQYLNDLSSVLDEYTNKRLIYEDWMSALDHDSRVNKIDSEKGTVFNFETLLNTKLEYWNAANFRHLIEGYYAQLADLPGAVPNQVTGNHDFDSLRSRLGSLEAFRSAILMLGALPGNLYMWQGDMTGRPDALFVGQPDEVNTPDVAVGQRDNVRTPLAWNSSFSGDFSRADKVQFWTSPFDEEYIQDNNVALQALDKNSPLRLNQAVLNMRKSDPALRSDQLRMLDIASSDRSDVLAFARPDPINDRRQLIVVTNFSGNEETVNIGGTDQSSGVVSLSSSAKYNNQQETVDLNNLTVPPKTTFYIDTVK